MRTSFAVPGDMVVVSRTWFVKARLWTAVGICMIGALADSVIATSAPGSTSTLVQRSVVVVEMRLENASNVMLIGNYLCKNNRGVYVVALRLGAYDFTCKDGAQFLRQRIEIKDSNGEG